MTHPVGAFLAGDLDALLEHLHPDVEIHGPALRYPIRGRPAARLVFAALKDAVHDLELLHELHDDNVTVLILQARVAGRTTQWVDVFEHDAHGTVTRLTVHTRPLSGPAAFGLALGPRLAPPGAARTAVRAASAALLTALRGIERATPRFVSQLHQRR